MTEREWVWIAAFTLVFATQRWFWVIGCAIGTIASAFAMLASIFHFQILAALGYLFLTMILAAVATTVSG